MRFLRDQISTLSRPGKQFEADVNRRFNQVGFTPIESGARLCLQPEAVRECTIEGHAEAENEKAAAPGAGHEIALHEQNRQEFYVASASPALCAAELQPVITAAHDAYLDDCEHPLHEQEVGVVSEQSNHKETQKSQDNQDARATGAQEKEGGVSEQPQQQDAQISGGQWAADYCGSRQKVLMSKRIALQQKSIAPVIFTIDTTASSPVDAAALALSAGLINLDLSPEMEDLMGLSLASEWEEELLRDLSAPAVWSVPSAGSHSGPHTPVRAHAAATRSLQQATTFLLDLHHAPDEALNATVMDEVLGSLLPSRHDSSLLSSGAGMLGLLARRQQLDAMLVCPTGFSAIGCALPDEPTQMCAILSQADVDGWVTKLFPPDLSSSEHLSPPNTLAASSTVQIAPSSLSDVLDHGWAFSNVEYISRPTSVSRSTAGLAAAGTGAETETTSACKAESILSNNRKSSSCDLVAVALDLAAPSAGDDTLATPPSRVLLTANQREQLCFAAFLEEVDALVGQGHLFKRSLLLSRAWWSYEAGSYVGTHALRHYLSDTVLAIMVCAVFQLHHHHNGMPVSAAGSTKSEGGHGRSRNGDCGGGDDGDDDDDDDDDDRCGIRSPMHALSLLLGEMARLRPDTHSVTLQGPPSY